jgi:hypothetical protein
MDVVTEALAPVIRQMMFRSTKDSRLSPRYLISLLAYSDNVYDLLGGAKNMDEAARIRPLENIQTQRLTNSRKAFAAVEKLLQTCPAPLVCHMTDGASIGVDCEMHHGNESAGRKCACRERFYFG